MGRAEFEFWEILSLLGALHGAFLAAVLWTHRRGNRTANRLLAALLLLFSVHLLHVVLYWTRSLEASPHFFGAPWFFPYLYGPLLFLYVRSLAAPGRPLGIMDGVHAIAFLAVTAASARFYLSSSEVKRRILEASYEQTAPAGGLVLAIFGLQYVHFLGYVFATLRVTADRSPGIDGPSGSSSASRPPLPRGSPTASPCPMDSPTGEPSITARLWR